MANDKIIWVLADDRPGNANQALGVAEALGLPFTVKPLAFNRLGRLPNPLLGASLVHLRAESARAICPPWPDVVIAAGRRAAPVARAIKRRVGGRAFLVQCMWPGPPAADIDLIATPAHDRRVARANLIHTIGAPHRVTPARLRAEAEAWRDRLEPLARPRLAVMVGGSTARHRFTPALAAALGQRVAELARRAGGALMVTTSRRTDAAAKAALFARLDDTAATFDWEGGGDNPYFAYLALADAVIVTGDSTAMCAEACATGHPVYIDAPPAHTAAKHKRLHDKLYELGHARPLDAALGPDGLADWRYPPLDDAAIIAREIIRRAGLPAPARIEETDTP